jgi:hypothetical protein
MEQSSAEANVKTRRKLNMVCPPSSAVWNQDISKHTQQSHFQMLSFKPLF